MFEFSKGFHYRWGWGDKEWFNPTIPSEKFKVQIGSCTRKHRSFREECVKAVQELTDTMTKPIVVGVSGGSDSLVVCLSLLDARIPFTPMIGRYVNEKGVYINDHDTVAAFDFCKRHGLKPVAVRIDIDNFYRNRAIEAVKEIQLSSVGTLAEIATIEAMGRNYSYIMGGDINITQYEHWSNKGGNPLWYPYTPHANQQFFLKHDYEACTRFFLYSPELLASYLDNPIMHGFYAAKNTLYDGFKQFVPNSGDWWTFFGLYVKPLFYHTEFPELPQRKKLTGYENFESMTEIRAGVHALNREVFGPLDNKTVSIRIDDLLEHLLSGKGATRTWHSRS